MPVTKQVKVPSLIITCGLLTAVFVFSFSENTAQAEDKTQGEKLFNNNCAACHSGGKNTLSPSKPVIGSKKLATKATFKTLLEVRNGMMPAFKAITEKDDSLEALYTYVKTLK